MRKPLIIALISLHLFGNTELPVLFRLPQLIHHYFQHHRQDPQLSFLEFLMDHYGGNDGTRADDEEDSKLPMHNQQDTHSLAVVFSPMIKADMTILPAPVYAPVHHETGLRSHILAAHVHTLLQPPRVA